MSDYDINSIHVSGTVAAFRRVETKTGTPMIRFIIQCWRERMTVVAFKDVAEFTDLAPGERVEVKGHIQSTLWKDENDNTRSGFQIIAKDIWTGGFVVDGRLAGPALPGPRNGRSGPTAQALPLTRPQAERPGVMVATEDENLPF